MLYSKKLCIVIPAYKEDMTYYENISFDRCKNVFKDYDRFLVVPEKLNTIKYENLDPAIKIVRFAKNYFTDVKAYSLLCKSKYFYQPFIDYQYMLVYQLDSFVFENNILEWIDKGYDYIGAPWLEKDWLYNRVNKIFNAIIKRYFNEVGNGGLSLRKVHKFYNIASSSFFIAKHFSIQEDLWWSNIIPRFYKFNIPDVDEALSFAFETNPKSLLKHMKGKSPFGCHAWGEYDKDFWRPIFKKYGYEI